MSWWLLKGTISKNTPTKLFISNVNHVLSPLSLPPDPVPSYTMTFSSVLAIPMFPFCPTTSALALYEPMPGLKNRKFCCFLLTYPAKPTGIISLRGHFILVPLTLHHWKLSMKLSAHSLVCIHTHSRSRKAFLVEPRTPTPAFSHYWTEFHGILNLVISCFWWLSKWCDVDLYTHMYTWVHKDVPNICLPKSDLVTQRGQFESEDTEMPIDGTSKSSPSLFWLGLRCYQEDEVSYRKWSSWISVPSFRVLCKFSIILHRTALDRFLKWRGWTLFLWNPPVPYVLLRTLPRHPVSEPRPYRFWQVLT